MQSNLETLQAEVLRLPPVDRARLLDRLISGLDVDDEVEAEWDALADKRDQELRSGVAETVSLETVIARLQAKLAR
jgi:hypothetical protein